MRMRFILVSIAVLLPSLSHAHARLEAPTPRSQSAAIKLNPPCGTDPRTAPTVFEPGQTIEVTWVETVAHPGWYRIAFSPANDQGFDQNVLADMIPNDAGVQNGARTVTLPNAPCEDCSIQLIQHMTDKMPPSNYYSCADIALRVPDAGMTEMDAGSTPPDAGSPIDAGTPDAGTTPTTDAGATGAIDAGSPPDLSNDPIVGGCSSVTSSLAGFAALGALFVVATRRRHRQHR